MELDNLRLEMTGVKEENSSLTQQLCSLEKATLETGNDLSVTKQVDIRILTGMGIFMEM